jgi:hypothetical protein
MFIVSADSEAVLRTKDAGCNKTAASKTKNYCLLLHMCCPRSILVDLYLSSMPGSDSEYYEVEIQRLVAGGRSDASFMHLTKCQR